MKKDRFPEIPNQPGIYRFTNKVNGKIYVGESKNLRKRVLNHDITDKNIVKICYFQRAIRKHGFDSFKVDILELCEFGISKKELLDKESYWILKLNSHIKTIGYNLVVRGSGASFCSEETRKKLSLAQKGKVSPNKGKTGHLAIWSWGRSMYPETKKKLRDINLGKKRPVRVSLLSKEQRFLQGLEDKVLVGDQLVCPLIAAAIKSTSKPVKQIDPKTGTVIRVWNSISEAARSFGGKVKNNISYIQAATTQKGGCKKWNGFGWLIAKDKSDYEPVNIDWFKRKRRATKPKT